MSHYTVAVFHRENQSIDELLLPFCEDTDFLPNEYLTWVDCTEDAKKEWEEYLNATDDDPQDTFEQYLENNTSYFYNQKLKQVGYYYNPNAKWDWYDVGGRWSDSLPLKDTNESVDEAKIGDIDFIKSDVDEDAIRRYWDVVVNNAPLREDEDRRQFLTFWKPEYFKERYGTVEQLIAEKKCFSTFAVLDENGEWHEPGEMGWFGINSADPKDEHQWHMTWYDRWIKDRDPEMLITIVDCHI